MTAARSRRPTPPSERLAGPDVVRAIALIGVVVMNYHGYLLIAGGDPSSIGDSWINRWFDPFGGPMSTRFAATFVLVAGVGVTLLTRSSLVDPGRVVAARWRLVRRGTLLYLVGLFLDEIWPGTIIPYYGAMFVLAALMFTWRTRWLVVTGIAAALAAAALRLWRLERRLDGHSTDWLTSAGGIRRFAFDLAINGTHPLLPWLTFLCAGMILGRLLGHPAWRRWALGTGLAALAASVVVARIADRGGTGDWSERVSVASSLDPFDRGINYVISALGSALAAYAVIDLVAEHAPRATEPLRRAGQLTLTLYLLHIITFNLLVDWLGWIEPTGLDTALALAAGFWIAAIAGASWWQQRFGRGPAEVFYRQFGG